MCGFPHIVTRIVRNYAALSLRGWRRVALVAVVVLAAVAMLVWLAARWSRGQANAAADADARQTARTHLALVSSELQKFRLLPLVLAEYPDVPATIGDRDLRARDRLNPTLEQLARRTDAAAIYVVDADGTTRAASNWATPASFVGQNYAFRPYFRDAMRHGSSEFFALGTVSGRPGLYLSRRLDRNGRAIGVVVVKVEFDDVEAAWARSPGISLLVDAHGVVLVTSQPSWRFHALAPIDAATLASLRRTLQFGNAPPLPAPVVIDGASARIGGRVRYRIAAEPAPMAGGRVLHLSPIDPPLATARTQASLAGAGLLLIGAILAAVLIRSAERQRLQARARAELEAEVVRRTAELSDANARLTIESEERAEADRRYRAAREELAQANRLASLGQITAGVAHEINQPVAAIRTFAENGVTFLDRAAPDRAGESFARIVGLADRIGAITGELRAFARRKTPAQRAVSLASVIDGVMLLIGDAARHLVATDDFDRATTVIGDRIRLEQILVNLIQNAIEAVKDVPSPRILLSTSRAGAAVTIAVEDNGPGIDPIVRDALFTPFVTGRANGLGLGLAIARDLAREFGGDLVLAPGTTGARFELRLKAGNA